MFRGFNLSGFSLNESDRAVAGWISRGRSLAAANRQTVKTTLEVFVTQGGALDGSRLQENWFPKVHAEVFISHSHADENMAMALAGWLSDTFSLTPFVDSGVWGYANDLLKRIDDEYCLNPGGETYSYERRNGSTSHVHIMLSTALGMMIDNTECLIFLNTKQSISSQDAVAKTKSPWLFAEIATARTIRKRNPRKPALLTEFSARYEKRASKAPEVEYDISTALGTLTEITSKTLDGWIAGYRRAEHALDALYRLTG